MLERYDKSGSIRGTVAFERFLKHEGDGAGEGEGDVTVKLDDGAEGGGSVGGPMQAIVMGYPESAMNKGGPRGLGTLERGDEGYFEGRGRGW